MYLLLYVHVCVTRTGWKTRPRPKTVILPIKKSINQSIPLSLSLSLLLPSDDVSPVANLSSKSTVLHVLVNGLEVSKGSKDVVAFVIIHGRLLVTRESRL